MGLGLGVGVGLGLACRRQIDTSAGSAPLLAPLLARSSHRPSMLSACMNIHEQMQNRCLLPHIANPSRLACDYPTLRATACMKGCSLALTLTLTLTLTLAGGLHERL